MQNVPFVYLSRQKEPSSLHFMANLECYDIQIFDQNADESHYATPEKTSGKNTEIGLFPLQVL